MQLLVDTGNLFHCVEKRYQSKIDFKKYLERIAQFWPHPLERMVAFVPLIDGKAWKFVDFLTALGFEVKAKEPREYSHNNEAWVETRFSVEIAIEALCHPKQNLILGSSDLHLLPVLQTLQNHEIHVLACGVPRIFQDYAIVHETSSKELHHGNATTA